MKEKIETKCKRKKSLLKELKRNSDRKGKEKKRLKMNQTNYQASFMRKYL
jgi:hypothetical protein